jgi:hypothetical protein
MESIGLESINITATDRTPGIDFNFAAHQLRLSGESYPEDATEFYNPIFEALDQYLAQENLESCQCEFALIYFNSSSAKAIMTILDKLDAAAGAGASVVVVWSHDEDDDNMAELGEEFSEDLEHVSFKLNVQDVD